jgi:hypothetical protein
VTRILLSTILLFAALTGCAGRTATPTVNHGTEIRLTTTLVSPVDVTVAWQDTGPAVAGHVVEYATRPSGPFTVLGFVPPRQTTYQHSDLMPDTTFYYRVLPYYGPASNTVDVTQPAGGYDDQAHANDQAWAAPRTVPDAHAAPRSIRRPASGRPTHLAAAVLNDNGVLLTWTGNATDEDGYLVETKPSGSKDFRAIQLLDRDINSCGVATLPDEKQAAYRVRAFYYGAASDIEHQTTGSR